MAGVRRSALISLSNLSDDRMRNAKTGQWWISNPQRALANNSSAYTEKPEIEIFLKEWLSLIESKSGERGIFNRVSATKKAELTGKRKTEGISFGVNPCISGDSSIQVKLDGKLETIRIDHLVSVFNEFSKVEVLSQKDGEKIFSTVTAASLTKKSAKLIKITDDKTGKFIKCTPDHLIATKNRGWVEAENLKEDDELIL